VTSVTSPVEAQVLYYIYVHVVMKLVLGIILMTSINPSSVKSEATGIYCALCVLLRQYEVEGCVNVFTTVTKLRKQRPGIFKSKVNQDVVLSIYSYIYIYISLLRV